MIKELKGSSSLGYKKLRRNNNKPNKGGTSHEKKSNGQE
jgi:hypothetical protein